MSEFISGKDALIALLSGKDVQLLYDNENWDLIEDWKSWDVKTFLTNDDYGYKFRLKPRTITLNGVELPKPLTAVFNATHKTSVELDFETEQDAINFAKMFSNNFIEFV